MKTYLTALALITSMLLSGCNNPCKELVCENGGFCHEGECLCQKWYSGETCQLKFNRNYAGTYYGSYTSDSPVAQRSQDSLMLTEAIEPNRLLAEQGFYIEFETDSTLIIPMQTAHNGEEQITVQGEGTYNVGLISIRWQQELESSPGVEYSIGFTGQRISAED